MAKRVFFSFHYQDVIDFRANVVRNHWLTKEDREEAGFFDASLWESTKTNGPDALKRLINSGLDNTTVTCVLIGSLTYVRPWVRYEILKSMKRGNKIIGVHINGIPDKHKHTKDSGPNPFNSLGVTYSADGSRLTMHEFTNCNWAEYAEIDGSTSYSINPPDRSFWGKGFNLAHFYKTYLWDKNNGYENFASWVE
ncbi:MAG: hypothetical protein HONDAALG_02554 [Gammaproteobacteria bacterium]|nr:hypothetical protein [Gammaproteobacteria bacterium]